jgi:hypothetical protein
MIDNNTQALQRPQHLFDLPRATVWTLAVLGASALQLAHSLDRQFSDANRSHATADRPRERLGPSQSVQSQYLIPDSWRIR